MEKQAIINRVKIRMEEMTPHDEAVVSSFPNIENIIDEVLAESARSLLLVLPVYLITPTSFYSSEASNSGEVQIEEDEYTGYFILPDDFLRLSSLKMNVWHRAVTRAFSEESSEYALQRSIYTRGGIAKPVAIIRQDTVVGGKILEYYSVIDDNHTVIRATYIPVQDADEIQDDLVDVLCWMIASKTFQVIDEQDLSKLAMQRVEEFVLIHKL